MIIPKRLQEYFIKNDVVNIFQTQILDGGGVEDNHGIVLDGGDETTDSATEDVEVLDGGW